MTLSEMNSNQGKEMQMLSCWCAYTDLLFGFDKGTRAGFTIPVGTLIVNDVLAAWRRTNDFRRARFTEASGVRYTSAPCWRPGALTSAAEALFSEAQQHALTHAAVGRLVKVLHPPDMLAIPLRYLYVRRRLTKKRRRKRNKEKANIQRMLLWGNQKCCHLQPEQNQQRHVVHPPLQPLFQSDCPTAIHVDGCHHVFKHLPKKGGEWGLSPYEGVRVRGWINEEVFKDSYWSELSYVPAEVICSSHHLSNYTIHFLVETNELKT